MTIVNKILTPLQAQDLTLYDIMVKLKEEYNPSPEEKWLELLNQFTVLKHYPKGRDLCDWVDDWSRLDDEMKTVGILE